LSLPRWLAQINKRVFNRIEIKRGVRLVLIHVGRSTGMTYLTPLDAHPVHHGYVFIPMYGPRTDWVKNGMAAGGARLRIDRGEIDLISPRLVRRTLYGSSCAQPPRPHRGSRGNPNSSEWTRGSRSDRSAAPRDP
jgi:hypothetical protein